MRRHGGNASGEMRRHDTYSPQFWFGVPGRISFKFAALTLPLSSMRVSTFDTSSSRPVLSWFSMVRCPDQIGGCARQRLQLPVIDCRYRIDIVRGAAPRESHRVVFLIR